MDLPKPSPMLRYPTLPRFFSLATTALASSSWPRGIGIRAVQMGRGQYLWP